MRNTQFYNCFSNRLFQAIVGITCLLFISYQAQGQVIIKDSVANNSSQTVVTIKKNIKPHPPKRAALFSTTLPGLGQAYNKKYWKIPIIYAGIGALAYSVNFNQKKYVTYRNAFRYRIDNDPNTIDSYVNIYNNDQLSSLYQYYHRFRDLSAIGVMAFYVFNIIDASVDAHLFTFDVSDDLSFHLQPSFINVANTTKYTSGLSLNIKF